MNLHKWRWMTTAERKAEGFSGLVARICLKCGLMHARYPYPWAAKGPQTWRRAFHTWTGTRVPVECIAVPKTKEPVLEFQI